MAHYLSTSSGIGRAAGAGRVEILDLPYSDVGAALGAGVTPEELASAPVAAEAELASLWIGPPVARPGKVWILGWAYRAHREETGREEMPENPSCFLKAPTAVTGPRGDIRLPRIAPDRVDYEGEVAVVIGRRANNIDEAASWDHVLGVTAANDVSARDVQRGSLTGGRFDPTLAKSFDTFLPMGPGVTTVDELADREKIALRTFVDGELRQEATTDLLIHSIPAVVSYLSRFTTLEPGDVILTGTPGGVGHVSERFLRPGSVVRVEVEGVGHIENRVVAPG